MTRRSRIRSLALALLALLLLSACSTQPLAQPGALDAFTAHLDAAVPALLRRYRVPGAAIALIHDGEVAWVQGYGLADVGSGTPVTADTVFQVASISKSVTAWGVMRLAEDGRVGLDAPVEQYLTSWHLPPSQFDHSGVTVRRLLNHTAGLAPWNYPGTPVGAPLPTLVELLSGANSGAQVHVDRQPGRAERYTNGGYTLLQLLVEDVTGEPFAAYMQHAVLEPLGMKHSAYQWLPELRSSTATGYRAPGQPVERRNYPEAAGGLYATAGDVATWLAAAMPGPNKEAVGRGVLQPQTVASMCAPVSPVEGEGGGLGYAVESLPNGVRMILHSGDIPGWRGQYTALPDLGGGIVVLTNSDTGRYVVADTTFAWTRWAAGDVPRVFWVYQAIYIAIPLVAAAMGLGLLASVWRLVAQLRSRTRRLAWPPTTERGRRDVILPVVAIALWWLLVVPRLGSLLPATFDWITLAYTLWCLAAAARGLTAENQPAGAKAP